ncbi:MAG TPA: glycosyltransferase [Streptosporangiaceae bacterium]|nr:glycosyltransferase [Streptosporangiaceae bacterium]
MNGFGMPARPALAGRRARVAVIITKLEGGAGVQALRGATALRDDFDITVVTGSGDRLLAQAAAAGLDVLVEPSLRTPIAPRADLTALRRLGSLLGRWGFDVVHTHTAKAGVLGRIAAHRAGAGRIVHTYHGFPFHEFQSAARRSAYVAIERRLGRITDLALCVGTGVAVEAVRRGLLPPERIRTIGVAVEGADRPGPVAVDGAGDPAARARARHALGLPLDATVVGAVGRLTYQKAPEDFLAALRLLGRPGVTGVWVGGGDLAGKVADLARQQPAAPVILAGERADVAGLLPAFDVFALPSRYEGLPTAVVEAMVCGVPVVATAVNAVADVVVPGETGLLVPPQRPDLMAGALRYLLDRPGLAAGMARAARRRIGDAYGMAALREALTCAYTPDVGGPTPHRPAQRRILGPMALIRG